jgi:hypothetical protein
MFLMRTEARKWYRRAALAGFAGLLISTPAWAGVLTDYTQITLIRTAGTGVAVNIPPAQQVNPANCSNAIGIYYPYPDRTAEQKNQMGRLLTAAFLAGKQVRLRISESNAKCVNGHPSYYEVLVYD